MGGVPGPGFYEWQHQAPVQQSRGRMIIRIEQKRLLSASAPAGYMAWCRPRGTRAGFGQWVATGEKDPTGDQLVL